MLHDCDKEKAGKNATLIKRMACCMDQTHRWKSVVAPADKAWKMILSLLK